MPRHGCRWCRRHVGLVVDNGSKQRLLVGEWDFDAPFTVLTTDEELIFCNEDCYVEIG